MKMKKLLAAGVVLALALSLTACGGDAPAPSASDAGSGQTEVTESAAPETGNTEYMAYMDQLEIGMSMEEINGILGFEGTVNPNSEQTYSWAIGEGGDIP